MATLIATDIEDNSWQTEISIPVFVQKDWSAVGAGIACGFCLFLLVIGIFVFRHCTLQKRYKLYDRANSQKYQQNRDDEIMPQNAIKSLRKESVSIRSEKSTNSMSDEKSQNFRKSVIDSDSGRGESSSETHSAKFLDNGTKNLDKSTILTQWCQAECLTLGHSDACWLPRETEQQFIVEVTSNQRTELSVWEETSDYSSHKDESDSGKIYLRQNAVSNREGVIV